LTLISIRIRNKYISTHSWKVVQIIDDHAEEQVLNPASWENNTSSNKVLQSGIQYYTTTEIKATQWCVTGSKTPYICKY
jgi:hypothetical protein